MEKVLVGGGGERGERGDGESVGMGRGRTRREGGWRKCWYGEGENEERGGMEKVLVGGGGERGERGDGESVGRGRGRTRREG